MSNGDSSTIARGGGTNTLNTRTVPIIFVPGVMGTRLMRPNGDDYWDPDHPSSLVPLLTASATIEGIMLNVRTRAVVMRSRSVGSLTADEINRGWAGPAWGFYGSILRALQNSANWGGNLCNVYAYGYDWRQSNTITGNGLRSYISSVLSREQGAEKVIIVTHSMGGLVARWACRNGAAASVKGVVHVVQPAVGAIAAYRRFKTGARSNLGDGDFGLVRILGNTAYKYQRIGCSLRGPFELLPSNHHPASPYNSSHWLTMDSSLRSRYSHPGPNIYDIYRESSGQVGLFNHSESGYVAREIMGGISTAEAFHRTMGIWFHDPTFVIAVDGHETDAGTDLQIESHLIGADTVEVNETLLGLSRRTYRAGDATVPIGSQTVLRVPSANQQVFRNASAPNHAEVFSSSAVNRKVIEFANRILNLP